MSTPTLLETFQFARQAHSGQTYGAKPYHAHLIDVMSRLRSPTTEECHVALLHDILEDTRVTYDNLIDRGYPKEVADAVNCLTRPQTGTYAKYIENIVDSGDTLASRVKIADLHANLAAMDGSDPSLDSLTYRYLRALQTLLEAESGS